MTIITRSQKEKIGAAIRQTCGRAINITWGGEYTDCLEIGVKSPIATNHVCSIAVQKTAHLGALAPVISVYRFSPIRHLNH